MKLFADSLASRLGSAALVLAAMAAVGCTATVYPDPGDGVVYTDEAPPNIEVYPHVAYGDGYAYYVQGRWYRRTARGWGYYRNPPPELVRQRPYVQEAPPARHEEHREHYEEEREGPGAPVPPCAFGRGLS